MHQTVVGLETIKQFDLAGEYPDVVIGCIGGGSNFSGFAFPFLHQNFTNNTETRVLAAEPMSCPTLTKGEYTFDFGDSAGMAPIVKMHTLGHNFVPAGIHAGGLRYHGMAPHVSALYDNGNIEAVALPQLSTFAAGRQFAQAEGIVPAPETTHAVKAAIDEAIKCKEEGTSRVITFNLCGHAHFDLSAYDDYLQGALHDHEYPEEEIKFDISKIKLVTIDIEVAAESGFPNVFDCAEELLAITLQDYTTKKIICFASRPFNNTREDVRYVQCTDEYNLIDRFLEYWERNAPEVISFIKKMMPSGLELRSLVWAAGCGGP